MNRTTTILEHNLHLPGLEFAFSQAPELMQGLVMGLFLLMSGLGSYASSLLLAIIKAASKGGNFTFNVGLVNILDFSYRFK